MGEVVSGPGCEELRQGDGAEGGMVATPIEVVWPEIQGVQFIEIGRAQTGKLIQ